MSLKRYISKASTDGKQASRLHDAQLFTPPHSCGITGPTRHRPAVGDSSLLPGNSYGCKTIAGLDTACSKIRQ
jgi:hypothetical protein